MASSLLRTTMHLHSARSFRHRLPLFEHDRSLFKSRTDFSCLASGGGSEQTSFRVVDDDIGDAVSALPSSTSVRKVNLPPRMCTLREFSDGDGMVAVDSDIDSDVSTFFESLAANVEFSARVQDWEILSGRLAMMVFASAVLVEAVTGNSVFGKMDPQRVLEICAAILASVVIAAGFAIALQAKTKVAYTMSKGYENLMNALIDNVFDTLLFDEEDR